MPETYQIHGTFWQDKQKVEISQPQGQGSLKQLSTRKFQSDFYCLVGREKMEQLYPWVIDGYMEDYFGHSHISDFKINGPHLSFCKRCDHNEKRLVFSFTKEKSRYMGVWELLEANTFIARGEAHCEISPAPESLFRREGMILDSTH